MKASKKLLNNVYNIEIFLNKTFNFKLSIIIVLIMDNLKCIIVIGIKYLWDNCLL